MPAFTGTAELDGVKIKVTAEEGTFPEDATLMVRRLSAKQQKAADAAVEEVRDTEREVAASYTFDIKVVDGNRKELQPAKGKTVDVAFTTDEVKEKLLTAEVYHIDSQTGKAEALEVEENKKKETATAETDGFSTYKLIFSQGTIEYDMQNASESLESLMAAVQLNGKLYNVVSSDERLTVTGPEGAPKESTASQWTIADKSTTENPITDDNPVELLISLYNRPDYRVYVTKSGTSSKHEIKLLHMDGHEVTASNPARSSEGIQVYVTGFSEEEQKQLTYKYSRKSGTAFYTFSTDQLKSGSADGASMGNGKDTRFFAYRGDSAKTTQVEISVTNGKTGRYEEIYASETITINAVEVNLQSDLNDAARALHPIVVRVGATHDLKATLSAAGIVHLNCDRSQVIPAASDYIRDEECYGFDCRVKAAGTGESVSKRAISCAGGKNASDTIKGFLEATELTQGYDVIIR